MLTHRSGLSSSATEADFDLERDRGSLTTESGIDDRFVEPRNALKFGQATKGARWMPWRREAMKDVASCDKPRGAASRL